MGEISVGGERGMYSSGNFFTVESQPEQPTTEEPQSHLPLTGWTVAVGGLQFGSFSAAGCLHLNDTLISGKTYTVHSSKWQTRADEDSDWADVPGTERTGTGICVYSPTAAAQYRAVAEITVDGVRGAYSSTNVLTVGSNSQDRSPSFGTATVSDRAYDAGTAISALTLPAATGGDGTLIYSLSPGVAGLSFNPATRQLTGTPTTAGTHSMTYTVRDADGDTSTLTFTITVRAADPSPSFGTATVSDRAYDAGTAISALTLPAATGGDGTLIYSLSPSVAGLSFNPATRQLTGTPTTAGTHSMTYTVRDADGDTSTLTFTITVQAGGGDDSDTQWTTGQTITSMPTGFWVGSLSGGTFQASGGIVSISLRNGGWVEYNNRRWTCASAIGCDINDRELLKGTIVETAAPAAP